MADNKYRIRVEGKYVPVTEETYLTYYRMRRHEQYLEEKDTTHGVIYYSNMDTKDTNGEDAVPDLTSPRVEDAVLGKLMVHRLYQCLSQLAKEEQELIIAIYFRGKSQAELEKETGVIIFCFRNNKIQLLSKFRPLRLCRLRMFFCNHEGTVPILRRTQK